MTLEAGGELDCFLARRQAALPVPDKNIEDFVASYVIEAVKQGNKVKS